jgi:FMN phosphatase YigB (HAD superfamily)
VTVPIPAGLEAPPEGGTASAANCGDARIRHLRGRVDSGEFDLLSLDVFDTLVWRAVPRPTDVFFLVADELRGRRALFESSSRESFVSERMGAEARARRRVPSHEVTLSDIYAEFPRAYLRGLEPQEVAEIEFRVEKRLVHVHAPMRDLLTRARSRGMRTALVSDTYFRHDQIAQLTGVEADFTLVSCEHGLSKRGGLHRRLLERSDVTPERVLHVGDDRLADVEGPAELDLARYWFPRFPEAYQDLLETELPRQPSLRSPYIAAQDGGLTALRGRVMFHAGSEHERWGAGILGPIVSGFCDWVAERCAALDIDHPLCLMREGRVFKQLLDLQAPGLEAREFFASRYVALRAAIFAGNEAELARFVLRPTPQARTKILEQLGLEPGDLPGGDEILTPTRARSLVRRIVSDRALRDRVVRVSAGVRRNLLRHLDAVLGPGYRGRIAVVDLGYRGTIQEALQRVLDRERPGLTTHGLYLVTAGDVHVTQAAGAVAEGWLAENGEPVGMAHTFLRSPEIVEQSLMADCGTTLGHDEAGEPVLDSPRVAGEQRREIAEIQRGLLLWSREWTRLREESGLPGIPGLRDLCRAIGIRMIGRPLDIELELFGGWQHDENFGTSAARMLAEITGLDEWEQAHLSAHQLASLPHARVYWPFGHAHGISRTMGEAVASIYLRTVRPEAFDSAEGPRHLVFYWDSGQGFRGEEARLETYRLNNRGRVWHRVSLRMGGTRIERLGFTIGLRGELLRLTGVRVHRFPRGGDGEVESHPHASIEKHGYRQLHDDLYRVEEDPALLVVPVRGLVDFTGDVHVDLFFSVVA